MKYNNKNWIINNNIYLSHIIIKKKINNNIYLYPIIIKNEN